MAAVDHLKGLEAIERQWIVESLKNQSKVLMRARSRELLGSEIYNLRTREIECINQLVIKLGG